MKCEQRENEPMLERLAHLNQVAWTLNTLHNQDQIIQYALEQAPRFVDAISSILWHWDADQQAPVLKQTIDDCSIDFPMPASLLHLLRQASESNCSFSIDAGECEESWPAEMVNHSVAFIPLSSPEGCQGILTVHHRPDRQFNHDDIFTLSSFGIQVATTRRNSQLHENHRNLVSLFQTSIRQVVSATSSGIAQREELVHSLLQVAEGLTRAGAICAVIRAEEPVGTFSAISRSHTEDYPRNLRELTEQAYLQYTVTPFPSTGLLREVLPEGNFPAASRFDYYTVADIRLGRKDVGFLLALSHAPLTDDQVTFLHTIAEQIGVGMESMQRSANNERLLVGLAEVHKVSREITALLDRKRILEMISQSVRRAINVPLVLCGWREEDYRLHLQAETTLDLPFPTTTTLPIVERSPIMNLVIEKGQTISHRDGWTWEQLFPALPSPQAATWLCIPMTIQTQTRGFMFIAHTEGHEFNPWEIALLSTYANEAGLKLENLQLVEKLELLIQFARSASSTLDFTEVLHEIMQAAMDAVQMQAGFICLAQHDGGVQTVAHADGIELFEMSRLHWEPDKGIIGTVWRHQDAVACFDARKDGRDPLLRDLARKERLTSSLTVLIKAHEGNLGTLTVLSREPRDFSPDDITLLQAIANEAGIAVQNARLYRQAKQLADRYVQLNDEIPHLAATLIEVIAQVMADICRTGDDEHQRDAYLQHVFHCITLVTANMTKDDPLSLDVKQALTQLSQEKPPLVVGGVRTVLPWREAVWLALLVHGWQSVARDLLTMPLESAIRVAFQQVGRSLLLDIEFPAPLPGTRTPAHAIIDRATQILQGSMDDMATGEMRRVHYRFPYPQAG